jgi:hypothetical protein
MNETVMRGTPDHQWREVAPLTQRVTGVVPTIPLLMGGGLVQQRVTQPDGKIVSIRLPVVNEPGQWVMLSERHYQFLRPDGSIRMVFVG